MAAHGTTDRLTFRSIRFRAALLTSVLVAVALASAIGFSFYVLRQVLVGSGEARATGVASQLAAALGPPIPVRLAEMQRLADDGRVRQAIISPSTDHEAAAVERLRPITANAAQHQTLELWNTAGTRVFGRQFPDADNRVPFADSAPTVTGVLPYSTLPSGVVVLEAVVAVRADDGKTVLGHVLSRRVATAANQSEVLNRLIGMGGRVLLGNQKGPVWTDTTKAVEAPPIDASVQGIHRYRAADGATRIAGVAHLPSTPMAILVEFPEDLFVAPAYALLRQMLIFAVLFTLAATLVVWRLTARVTRPLATLADGVRAISAGNYGKRVEVGADSEVAQLAEEFNTMAARIDAGLTEIKARADEVQQKDRRKAAMMNAALDGIVTTNTDGIITDCNPAAVGIFGREIHDVVGHNLGVLLGFPDFGKYVGLSAYLADQRHIPLGKRTEFTGTRSGGATFAAEATIVAVGTDSVGYAAFIRDLTEQKAGEQALLRGIVLEEDNRRVQEASRMKSEFLANMSHELRTPLNAIIGFAELLYDGQVTPDMPEFKDFMHDILKSGQHLLQLINDVLDLSKVEAGRLEFHPEDTSLTQVFTDTAAMLRTIAAQKQLQVIFEVDPSVERVYIDRSRLKQVLYNYLSNAIKFTPERGKVSIFALPIDEERFRIDVIDTGIGIAGEDLSKLFIEFNQLEAGADKSHQGTGLGLALTKRLVEAQGGTVAVASTVGRGSTFSAILPRRATGGTPLSDPRSIRSARIGAPSVLVIEDDPRDQEAIVSTLVGAGFNVETANSRAQALVKLAAQTFDAITLDLILPDATGADILTDLRQSPQNANVPVVVITIVANSGAVGGFAVHDILAKPVEGTTVIAALDRAGVSTAAAGSVLVVDDDPGSLRLMAATLQQLGFRSTCVERAVEGLRISEAAAPLAVVLDLQMPGMDGFAFLDHFRRIPSCAHVPVIVWTVKDLTLAELERLKASAQGVTSKGHGGRSVVEELRRFVARPARREASA